MTEVTLKDIAKECRVSFSTVSKALKDSNEIGEKTKRLIQETAKRMGYHPNAAARTLRTNHSYDIGVIFEDTTGSGLQHQYFAQIFDAINVSANRAGYDITFLSYNTERDYLSQARHRGCDGVIIVSTVSFHRADIKALLDSPIPVCTLDYEDKEKHSAILSDNKDGIKVLMENIIAKGHRKIAFIHGDPDSDVTKSRIETFMATARNYGISIPPRYIVQGVYHDPIASAEATKKLLLEQEQPTCIIYPDDFAALGGIRVLSEHHFVPGKNISIAGYDGIFLSSLLTPPLTTYQQNAKELGQQLVSQLLKNIEDPQSFVPSSIKIAGHIVEGGSVIALC